jgi:integrase
MHVHRNAWRRVQRDRGPDNIDSLCAMLWAPDVAAALEVWRQVAPSSEYVIASERGGPMTALSIVVWFNRAFKNIGLKGCSSHSGRRTFVTRAARIVHKTGGSLRDVQLLAGHRSILTTQRYIDGDSDAQRKLVAMI